MNSGLIIVKLVQWLYSECGWFEALRSRTTSGIVKSVLTPMEANSALLLMDSSYIDICLPALHNTTSQLAHSQYSRTHTSLDFTAKD